MNTDTPQDKSAQPVESNETAPKPTPASVPLPQPTAKRVAPAAEAASAGEARAGDAKVSDDAIKNPEGSTIEQLREQALEATKNVFDPEIPVNIYELGLIYDVAIDENRNAKVTMTLTSPACPAAQELPMEVQGRIAVIHGINDVEVDVVFDPPWSPDKMSEAAKVQLGFDL